MQLAKFLLITGIIVLAIALYSLKVTLGQEELSGKLIVDTKHHEWEDEIVKTTVTVLKSECQSCVEQVNLKDCHDLFKICLDVN